MKKIIVLLASFSIFSSVRAQIPFPTDQAIWVNGFYQEMQQWPNPIIQYVLANVTNYCVNGQDTLINSISYTKVNECEGAYHGALREVGLEVWYVPKDSTVEYLIYDFSVTPGEVLQNVYFEQGGFSPMVQDLTVVDVTTVQINGVDHIAVDFGSGPGFFWIEGIGSTSGFLCEPWQNISQYMVKLECMSLAGITYYPSYSLVVCPMDLGFDDVHQSFSFSPNPVKDVLNVSYQSAPVRVQLYDPLGRILKVNCTQTSEGIEFDMRGLEPGIYILGSSVINGQKVVKL